MIEILRRLKIQWSLTDAELARLSHTPVDVLNRYLGLNQKETEALPTVPAGLENAVALISVFSSLNKLRPQDVDQHQWLREPNSVLENQIPIQVMMMSANHLAWVSYTLDSALREQNL